LTKILFVGFVAAVVVVVVDAEYCLVSFDVDVAMGIVLSTFY
jgi:hypothetical protein